MVKKLRVVVQLVLKIKLINSFYLFFDNIQTCKIMYISHYFDQNLYHVSVLQY